MVEPLETLAEVNHALLELYLKMIRQKFVEKALQWLPEHFTGEDFLIAYAGVTYYGEAFRFDFTSEP